MVTTPPQTLAVGQTKTIRVTATVSNVNLNTTYQNTAQAKGVSPSSKDVNDLSDNGIVPDPNHNGNAGDPNEDDPTPVKLSESPAIGIAKSVAAVTNLGGGSYTVVYNLIVQNLGNVPLSNVQVTDNLAATFAGATIVQCERGQRGLHASTRATTATAQHQPAGRDREHPGGGPDQVDPAHGHGHGGASASTTYSNQATATGVSPAGSLVSDLSDAGVTPDPDGEQQRQRAGRERPDAGEPRRDPGHRHRQDGCSRTRPTATAATRGLQRVVKNLGNVSLNNVQVTDDLALTFTGATSFDVTA